MLNALSPRTPSITLVDDLGVHHNAISLRIFSLFFSASYLGRPSRGIQLLLTNEQAGKAGRQAEQSKNVHYILSAYALWIFGAGKPTDIYMWIESSRRSRGREGERISCWVREEAGRRFRCKQWPDEALTLSATLPRPLPALADTLSI